MSEPYKKWLCIICGLVYDEQQGWPRDGIEPGTRWQDVPDDWLCPDCLVGKSDFEMIEMPAAVPNPVLHIPRVETTPNGPIVIIGSGYAGYNLAAAVREHKADAEIVILTADDGLHYSKPALSTGLLNQQQAEDLVSDKPLDMANRLAMRIVTHCQVVSIDKQAKIVHTDLGQQPYGQLVLATGAQPIHLPIAGPAADNMFSVNSLQDYRRYRQALAGKRKVLVIGNGLIGCEFANDLAATGYQVDLVGLTSWPMDRLLPERIGRKLQSSLQSLGVTWYLENTVTNIDYFEPDETASGYRVTLSDGQQLQADVLVSAVGLQARMDIAVEAGIDCHVGIQVDGALATSAPHIYALGDCIEIDGQLMPYISPIHWGIQALAQTLTGTTTSVNYPLMTVMVKTPACPLSLLPPAASIKGAWQVEENEQGMIGRFVDKQGNLQGFVLQGGCIDRRGAMLQQVKRAG
ncbi:MAG: FAD-dependent oxidoreductase [Gammaproteobacteria bacterium]|nr:FAD-dependent oxidoreductase [Gammaproteobacteria bacterium]MCP4881880.1 FAD-dependent oxidoreductase [Gammaproteobacteria bacterium]MDP6165019.1 FAD-dependent oxidoreductase [Gammaproteobacteria bacterium]